MYCKNCGKFIGSDVELCDECAAAKRAEETPNPAAETPVSEETLTPPENNETPIVQNTPDPAQNNGYYPPAGGYYPPQYQQPFYGYAQPGQPVYAPAAPATPVRLGGAITSMILSFFGFIFAYAALIAGAIEGEAGMGLLFFALPLSIIGVVFGAKSIGNFRATTGAGKRIPTLILGISGLTFGILSLFFAFLAFIFSIATL